MLTVLITGANRGIGLELVKHYLDHGDRVIGTYRETTSSKELIQMSENHKDLKTLKLDVSSDGSLIMLILMEKLIFLSIMLVLRVD